MEASMLSMHQSKFVLDVQNHEKQSFCKNIKVTQQGINVTLNSFLASMELKNLFYLRHCQANKILFANGI